jgi:bromodomain-containing protein 7/9
VKGYSDVIKHPMDISTMKSKVERGVYNSWSDLQADLVLMVTNAKTFNEPKTLVHKQADVLLISGLKMVRNFKQGKTKLRGFTGGW